MSDPMNRPLDPPPPTPPPESQTRNTSPLLWLVLLIALIALVWYVFTRRSIDTDLPAPLPPTQTAAAPVTPDDDTAAAPRLEPPAPAPRAPSAPARPDRDAEPIARLQPEYPPEAFRAGEEGTVLVRAQIDANGVPSQVEVANRSGSRELDLAAVEAVRKWRFEPAVKNGARVASTIQVPVDFKLDRQ